MDWMSTNNSLQTDLSSRPKLSDARWSTKGVPVEVMVELSNLMGADPWFTVPHLATDDYATRFASLVRSTLDASRTVYVEHSNEVWNAIFAQASYAKQRGLALGLSSNEFEAQLRYHAKRSVELFRLWEDVLGGSHRLVRVMGSFSVSPWVTETLLRYPGALETTDALAVAPYFGHELGDPNDARYARDRLLGMTPDAILAEVRRDILPGILEDVREQAELVSTLATEAGRRIDLVAYEGGQHIVGVNGRQDDAQLNALFDELNRRPAMKDIYLEYLEGWRDGGGALFMHFVNCSGYTKWGRWGAMEFLFQSRSEAPKYDALQAFIESNLPWW